MNELHKSIHNLNIYGEQAHTDALKALLDHAIRQEKNDKAKEYNDKEYIFKTNDEVEFLYAFNGLHFLLSLSTLDKNLRSEIKYNQNLNKDVKKGLQMARDHLREAMSEYDVSLDMLK